MNYNFTERARKVLAMSREEAIRLRHDYVGTEHILLGLIREGESLPVLTSLSIDLSRLQGRIVQSVRAGSASNSLRGELPYTSRAKKVFEFAWAEARELGHSYMGTEHLLLGLLREDKGIAAEVLNQSGVTLEKARRETFHLFGSEVAARPRVEPSGPEATRHQASGVLRSKGAVERKTVLLEGVLAFQMWYAGHKATFWLLWLGVLPAILIGLKLFGPFEFAWAVIWWPVAFGLGFLLGSMQLAKRR